uniref:Uncharacterized protein n=1 Tax=Meloidogyne enterolobii TaxID=390850 RepID=A0A6V7W7B8_MELEN|nr:unnamed protein product [Meloidogyne enterolobii]
MRWRKEYLVTLRDRSKWDHVGPRLQINSAPKLGEVVLVEDLMRPRNEWTLAKIVELNGHPGPIRSVKLLMPNGRISTRPVNKIFPLEASPLEPETSNEPQAIGPSNSQNESVVGEELSNQEKGSPVILEKEETQPEPQALEYPKQPVQKENKEIKKSVSKHAMITRRRAKLAQTQLTLGIIFLLSLVAVVGNLAAPICDGCPSCKGCLVHCSKAGVSLFAPEKISKIQICCPGSCSVLPGQKEITHYLPRDILVNDYTCHANFWDTNHEEPFEVVAKCSAFNPCQLVNCYFCLDLLANPSCDFKMFTFVLISIAFPSFLILSCLCGALQRIFRPFRAFIGIFRSLNRWGTRKGELAVDKGKRVLTSKKALVKEKAHGAKKKIQKESKKFSEASLARLAKYGITLIVFVLLTHLASSDTISVMSESENCRINNNTRICSVSSSTTLTLLPAGQPTNLLIKDEKGEILGALTFSLLSLTLNCNPKTLAFLRSYRINTRSVWRCPTTGSCSGSFCSNVGANTHVPEVVEVMKEPGASGCKESSALWSKGCGLPTASCHFYRWYAVPTSLDLFELFTCPTWDFHIKALFQLTLSSQTYEESAILQPGLTHHWLNTSITPIAVTNPPSPTLSTPFLTNGFSVALGQDVPRDLKCADAQSALGFGCNISKDACRECHPTTDGLVQCQCRELDGEAILEDPEKRLPLSINRQTFLAEGETVQVEQPYSPIQIHFRMSSFKLVNEITESVCKITIESIGGCYKCATGVQIKFSCNTNFGVALAHIKCDDGINFVARCSKEGIEGIANFAYNRSQIETKCKVICPGGESPLQLQGQLLFIPLKWRRDKSIHSVQGEAPSQVGINLLKFHPFSLLLSNFFPNFQIFIPIIFISIIIILTITLRFKLKLLRKLTTLFPLLLFFSLPGGEGKGDRQMAINICPILWQKHFMAIQKK